MRARQYDPACAVPRSSRASATAEAAHQRTRSIVTFFSSMAVPSGSTLLCRLPPTASTPPPGGARAPATLRARRPPRSSCASGRRRLAASRSRRSKVPARTACDVSCAAVARRRSASSEDTKDTPFKLLVSARHRLRFERSVNRVALPDSPKNPHFHGESGAAPSTITKYYHRDHLGSVTAMSDEVGHIDGAGPSANIMAYDPWGTRRNPDETAADPASFDQQVGRREFTGQETIPNVGLINMNGRVYDPAMARFLTPDPNVQSPDELQSYNRYSYLLNNPLRYTDPTGYFFDPFSGTARTFLKLASQPFRSRLAQVRPVADACLSLIAGAMYNTTAVVRVKAPLFQRALFIEGIGLAAGWYGGELAGYIGAEIGGGGRAAAMVSDAIGGAVSSTITSVALTHNLGWNVFEGAAIGATSAAYSWTFAQSGTPVAQTNVGQDGQGDAAEGVQGDGDTVTGEAKGGRGPRFLDGRGSDDTIATPGSQDTYDSFAEARSRAFSRGGRAHTADRQGIWNRDLEER